jgi:RHS repeat-associated protein
VVISNSQYDLDVLNRLTTEHNNGTNRNFEYDKTDQVKLVSGSNSEGYTYDKNGNRTNAGYVTGVGNRLLSDGVYNYQYDDEGNRTKRTNILTQVVDDYTWDYRNRLIAIVTSDAGGAVIKTVGYEYDVDDQRVGKQLTIDTSTALSASNGQLTTTTRENYYLDRNQIAFVTDGDGNETFHYLYGLNIDQVLAQDSPTGMLWSLADRLGTVDTLTDAVGNVVDTRTYDSFGKLLNQSDPTVSFRYGYTGREEDKESGLDYYRARYYDPNVGRFISVDPIGFDAGDTNLYRYVGNNSTNATDPSGNFVFVPILLGAIALGGAFGAGYAVADHLEKGGSLNNIDWQDTWEKATIGAFGAAVITTGAAAIATGLTAAGVAASTVQAGGLIFGAAGTGWQAGSGINNIANGKPLTGALDLIGAGLGIFGLNKGYQGYRQTLTNENIAKSGVVWDVPGNPRPISQVGNSQLNSSGEITINQSPSLTTNTTNTSSGSNLANNIPNVLFPGQSYNIPVIDPWLGVNPQDIAGQFIPTTPIHINDNHSINTMKANTRFGDGNKNTLKTIARGDINLSFDEKQINAGQGFRLRNDNNILAPSGVIYGTHSDGRLGIFPRSGSPRTVDLNQAEFQLLKTMIRSGGLKDDAQRQLDGYIISGNKGITPGSQQKLIDLYNSRRTP